MNLNIIKNYIDKISESDIYECGLKQGVKLTEKEVNYILFIIKNDFENLIYEKEKYLNKIKNNVSENTYLVIVDLFNKYKGFINCL